MQSTSLRAHIAFGLITVFWGITFPLIRISVQTLTPSQFIMVRFGLALLLLLPFFLWRAWKIGFSALGSPILRGLFLGVISWVSYQSQTLGLQTIEAGRAAFITGTSVVLIPLMSPLFGKPLPKRADLGAAGVALLGLYLLTDPSAQGFAVGDLWVMLCAIFYALFVHLFQLLVTRDTEALALTFSQLFGVFLCGSILSLAQPAPLPPFTAPVIWGVGVCAIFATVLANLLQTYYQPYLTPEKAALIFSLESVFASLFGYWILGEVLSLSKLFGCLLIFGSIIGSELFKYWSKSEQTLSTESIKHETSPPSHDSSSLKAREYLSESGSAFELD